MKKNMRIKKSNIKTTSYMKWFFVYFFIILLASCKTDLSKVPQLDAMEQLPQLSVTNFTAYYKISSSLKAEAKAPVMNKYTIQKNYTEFPFGVEVKFYDEGFIVNTSLNCSYAINYTNQELWRFSDDVVVESTKGGTLKTQELYFDQKKQMIYSVKYVEVTDPNGTIIRGKGGFESNYDFTIYEFKNVDGIMYVLEDVINN